MLQRKISRSKGLKNGREPLSEEDHFQLIEEQVKSPQGKSMFVEKLEGRQYGWSSTLKGKEAGDQVGEGAAEART